MVCIYIRQVPNKIYIGYVYNTYISMCRIYNGKIVKKIFDIDESSSNFIYRRERVFVEIFVYLFFNKKRVVFEDVGYIRYLIHKYLKAEIRIIYPIMIIRNCVFSHCYYFFIFTGDIVNDEFKFSNHWNFKLNYNWSSVIIFFCMI